LDVNLSFTGFVQLLSRISMKTLSIAACAAGLWFLSSVAWSQPACTVTVLKNVEVAKGEFSLADLFAPGACPAWLERAARVRLGKTPTGASTRVLAGDRVRELVQTFVVQAPQNRSLDESPDNSASATAILNIPQRITVRGTDTFASCADIVADIGADERISATLDRRSAENGSVAPWELPAGSAVAETDCGIAAHIPREASLAILKTVWDGANRTWNISIRCVRPGDCSPFLLRVSGSNLLKMALPARPKTSETAVAHPLLRPVEVSRVAGEISVRPGQTVTLIWDQAGIRAVVPVICLDHGGLGQQVRARIPRGGRVVRAIVLSAGRLQAVS